MYYRDVDEDKYFFICLLNIIPLRKSLGQLTKAFIDLAHYQLVYMLLHVYLVGIRLKIRW